MENNQLQEKLETLLKAYAHYFDVERDVKVEGGSFPAAASYHFREENYVATRAHTIYASEQHEYVYFYLTERLDLATLQKEIDLSREAGGKKVTPHGEHMPEKIYGLLGRKLGHSWSVPIHTAAGNQAYRLIELEPEELPAFLARPDIGGLNVTIPYKRDVMPLCDVIDPDAQSIGSVNTLVRRADGKLCAWNTDISGFLYMARRAGLELRGHKVVILGSGGTSLTAQAAARVCGAREIVVVSRRGMDSYENLGRHADAEIVVNTTPVGMECQPKVFSVPIPLEGPFCILVNTVRQNYQCHIGEHGSRISEIQRADGQRTSLLPRLQPRYRPQAGGRISGRAGPVGRRHRRMPRGLLRVRL